MLQPGLQFLADISMKRLAPDSDFQTEKGDLHGSTDAQVYKNILCWLSISEATLKKWAREGKR